MVPKITTTFLMPLSLSHPTHELIYKKMYTTIVSHTNSISNLSWEGKKNLKKNKNKC
jgi:hypothetical protein